MKRTGNVVAVGIMFGLGMALQSGCAVMQSAQKPGTSPQRGVEPDGIAETRSLSGTVIETMSAGGYTYVNLEKGGGRHGPQSR